MIIDVTGFVGRWPYWENKYADASGDSLVSLMDRWEIDKCVVTSLCSVFYDDAQGNEMAFQAAERHPDRLLPAAAVSTVTDKDNREYLKYCRDRGATMLKLYPLYHGYSLTAKDPDLELLTETAAELGMVVAIPIRVMMNWGLPALGAEAVIRFMEDHPAVTFLVENFNAGEYLPLVKAAARSANVYLATGALTRYRGIEDMVKLAGEDRILGACNAPLQYVACGLGKIRGAEISAAAKEKILGGNAVRLLFH